MTDYDINDDDLPTFSPRDVMRRLAQLDRLAERVEAIDLLVDALKSAFDKHTHTESGECAAPLWETMKLIHAEKSAPTPPPDPAPDEAAPDIRFADLSRDACDATTQCEDVWDWDRAGRRIVKYAIALGLAAPADRVVATGDMTSCPGCDRTRASVGTDRYRECECEWFHDTRESMDRAAAYWSAGADTQGEGEW